MYSDGPPKPSSVGSTTHEHDDRQRDAGRDQERALAHPLGELAPGDEPDGVHLTASRNRSASVGRSIAKYVTRPAARAASSTASGSAPSKTVPRGAAVEHVRARHVELRCAVDDHPHGAGALAAQLLDRRRTRPAGRP